MKFKISQVEFARALNSATKALSTKASLPVLANVYLGCSKNKLEIIATNLETAIRAVVECVEENEGKVTVPGKILVEFISGLPEGEIVVELIGEEVLLSTKGYSARLSIISAEEFPAIPKIENGIDIKINSEDFVRCANKVSFSAASDEGRPVLNGVLLTAGKKDLEMVATDGFRLSFAAFGLISPIVPLNIVVPSKTLLEVARIIMESEIKSGEFSITVAQNLSQINFKIGNVEFTSRLIEGAFPAWEKIIPATFSTKVELSKEEFLKAIKVASIFARDSGNIIKLNFSTSKVLIAASTSQVGSNEVEVEAAVDGRGGEIAFNFRYLVEALGAVEAEKIVFEMSESLTPGKITAEEVGNFFHIIMPVRLQA